MPKHILITGASSGVGRALAIKLSLLGFDLSLSGKSEKKLQSTLSQLKGKGRVHSSSFCLSQKDEIANFILQSEKKLGGIDIQINCAGLNSSRASSDKPDWQKMEWMMKINYFAPLRFIELVLPSMLEKKSGVIINVLSTTCLFSNPGTAQYSASKSALDTYSKVLRKELYGSGVKVISVYPGGINTDFREKNRPDYLKPEDVSDAIVYLLCTSSNVHVHELVIRPEIENNFG